MKQPPQMPPQMNLDLSATTDIRCSECGNYTFEQVHLLKHVPAVASPNGKAGIVPIPTFSCNACGNVNEELLPAIYRQKKEEAPAAESKPVEEAPRKGLIEIVK